MGGQSIAITHDDLTANITRYEIGLCTLDECMTQKAV